MAKLYLTDIIRFHDNVLNKRDLIHRIESEYKQGKAYRYYSNNFIGEVFINNINTSSKFCLFRTKYVPSQGVTMKQYDVRVIVRKDINDAVGGEILNAYFTCTAGLLGSCNHVAGLLFRIEAAVLLGYTHTTCTSKLSAWNIPTHKKQIEPGEVVKFLLTKDTYMKKAIQPSSEERKRKAQCRINFQVMFDSQAKKILNSDDIRADFFNDVSNIIPRSCFTEFMEARKKKIKIQNSETVPSLVDCAKSFKDSCDPELDIEFLHDAFTDSLIFNEIQIKTVYDMTKTQSKCSEWTK